MSRCRCGKNSSNTSPSVASKVGSPRTTYLGTYIGAHTVNFVSPMIENHAAPKTINEPTEYKNAAVSLTNTGFSQGNTGMKIESCGVAIGVTGITVGTSGLFQKADGLAAEVEGLESRIIALDGKVGAMSAKLNPRVNAAPTVATSAPFGA